MNLGENIYRLRIQKNMSQGDLADALDVSRQSVSKWENNSAVPELDKLIKMSELFAVSLDTLVGRSDPPCEKPEAVSSGQSLSIRQILGIILFVFTLMLFIYPYFLSDASSAMVPDFRYALLGTCIILTVSLLAYQSTAACWICVGLWLASFFLLLYGSDSRFLLRFFIYAAPVCITWGSLRIIQFYKETKQ